MIEEVKTEKAGEVRSTTVIVSYRNVDSKAEFDQLNLAHLASARANSSTGMFG